MSTSITYTLVVYAKTKLHENEAAEQPHTPTPAEVVAGYRVMTSEDSQVITRSKEPEVLKQPTGPEVYEDTETDANMNALKEKLAYQAMIEQITGNSDFNLGLVKIGNELLLKFYYQIGGALSKIRGVLAIRYRVDNEKDIVLDKKTVSEFVEDEILSKRLTHIFSKDVVFTGYDLSFAMNPEKTTGKIMLFGVNGKLDEEPEASLFRFQIDLENPDKKQFIHLKGMPKSLEKWVDLTDEGAGPRRRFLLFTSAFRESICCAQSELKVRCTGFNSLRYKRGDKEKKQKVSYTTPYTKVESISPVGFKLKRTSI